MVSKLFPFLIVFYFSRFSSGRVPRASERLCRSTLSWVIVSSCCSFIWRSTNCRSCFKCLEMEMSVLNSSEKGTLSAQNWKRDLETWLHRSWDKCGQFSIGSSYSIRVWAALLASSIGRWSLTCNEMIVVSCVCWSSVFEMLISTNRKDVES